MSSVRGLRRPAEPIRMRSREPPEHSPYLEFVRRKQAAEPEAAAAAEKEPPKAARKGALSKFMI